MISRKKVVCIGRRMHGVGGLQKYIIELYRNIDHSKINMDFIIPWEDREGQIYLKEIEDNGSKVHLIPHHKKNLLGHFVNLAKVLVNDKSIDIIHIHTTSSIEAIDGLIARILKKKVMIIYHSHNTSNKKSLSKKLIQRIYRSTGNYFFACSTEAGISLFGDKIIKNNNFVVAKNGIKLDEYKFNYNKRQCIRNEFRIDDDTKLIGFIGRFTNQKNPIFIIDIFNEVLKINKKARLMLIGSGELEKDIRERIEFYGIQKYVIMTGPRYDISTIMSALDIFVMPSLYEGLGIVLVEAQAAGVYCYTSDKVPKESKLSDIIEYISLEKNPEEWASLICEEKKSYCRENSYEHLKIYGYDIKDSSNNIQNIYLEHK